MKKLLAGMLVFLLTSVTVSALSITGHQQLQGAGLQFISPAGGSVLLLCPPPTIPLLVPVPAGPFGVSVVSILVCLLPPVPTDTPADIIAIPISGDITAKCTPDPAPGGDKCYFGLVDEYEKGSPGGVQKNLVSTGTVRITDPILGTTVSGTGAGAVRFLRAQVLDPDTSAVVEDHSGSAPARGTAATDGSGSNILYIAPAGRAVSNSFGGATCVRSLKEGQRTGTRFLTKGGMTVCAKKSQVTGSLLEIYEPESLPAGIYTEVPFFYESSDDYWSVSTSFTPPPGCTVDDSSQSVTVDGSTEALVFDMTCNTAAVTAAATASRPSGSATAVHSLADCTTPDCTPKQLSSSIVFGTPLRATGQQVATGFGGGRTAVLALIIIAFIGYALMSRPKGRR